MDVEKSKRVPVSVFFGIVRLLFTKGSPIHQHFDTSKSFCYFWALDIAPTWASPACFGSPSNDFGHLFFFIVYHEVIKGHFCRPTVQKGHQNLGARKGQFVPRGVWQSPQWIQRSRQRQHRKIQLKVIQNSSMIFTCSTQILWLASMRHVKFLQILNFLNFSMNGSRFSLLLSQNLSNIYHNLIFIAQWISHCIKLGIKSLGLVQLWSIAHYRKVEKNQ